MAAEAVGQDQRLAINLDGRPFSLEARVFRPSGGGPFPLVLINHGLPGSMDDARSAQMVFTRASQWFASQGYMAVEILRPGFGASDGPFMEPGGPCGDRDYVHDGRETAAVEAAIAVSAAKLPGADARRIIVVGHSVGGLGAMALADTPPAGVIAVISFAGGRGSDVPGHICSGAQRLIDAAAVFGKSNQLPQLWLVAANDQFFAPALEHAMAAAYQAGSKPPIRLVDLPAFEEDGHMTFVQADPSVWAPSVSAFLTAVVHSAPR
jgi:dienelactone hydrolase